MINLQKKYSYNDVAIVPSPLSEICHRAECNPFVINDRLPIFASPMDTVVDLENVGIFESNHITPIIPRTIPIWTRIDRTIDGTWCAYSLDEFTEYFATPENEEMKKRVNSYLVADKICVLIDIANGHMKRVYDLVKISKEIFGSKICIMVGNIANPQTYRACVDAGVDYVRCSIGTGACCITSTQLGVHYPIASLISETFELKQTIAREKNIPLENMPKIVADGGCRNYSDVIKALALGADYVMVGSMFASLIESAASLFLKDEKGVSHNINHLKPFLEVKGDMVYNTTDENQFFKKEDLYKVTYGMASVHAQIAMFGSKTKTIEGIKKTLPLTTNLHKWSKNMIAYLRSAMSYTNITNVKDMAQAEVIIISENTKNSINK